MRIGGTLIELHLHLEVVALCLGLLLAYWALIRRYGALMRPRPDQRPVETKQVVAYVSGVVALWVASGSPLHDLAERYLYSAHMLQHLIQAFVVPPLLLLGIPEWMGEVLLRRTGVRRVVKGLSGPLVAALLFNVSLAVLHWPEVVGLMLTSELFHAASHVLLIGTGLFMWMNVVSPVPSIVPRLSPLAQMFYLFTMTLLPTVPASFLTLGETALYPAYEAFPRIWGLSALDDMRIAGLIMKLGGGFLLWGIIVVMYFRWAADEERKDRRPTPRPSDVPIA